MTYKKIKSYEMSEADLRALWKTEYCDPAKPVLTFDGIRVKFFPDMFDHAFYESDDWKEKDKSILSLNRCEKMLWIKEALQDSTAKIKVGWQAKTKSYAGSRRVTIVKGDYVVIIQVQKEKEARFVTAYQVHKEETMKKILDGPDWK